MKTGGLQRHVLPMCGEKGLETSAQQGMYLTVGWWCVSWIRHGWIQEPNCSYLSALSSALLCHQAAVPSLWHLRLMSQSAQPQEQMQSLVLNPGPDSPKVTQRCLSCQSQAAIWG